MRLRYLCAGIVLVLNLFSPLTLPPHRMAWPGQALMTRIAKASDVLSQPLTWTKHPTVANLPPAAEDCAAIYDSKRHRMILYGGKDDQDTNLNQTWALELTTGQWTHILPSGLNPPPLEDHTVIYDPLGDRMILFGGEANEGTMNETWSLDLQTMAWTNITSLSAPPREDHTAVYDAKQKRMVIFGGRENEMVNLSTIFALDLDLASPTHLQWFEIHPQSAEGPRGRVDHAAIYDAKRHRMVIFGGWDKENDVFLADTWVFDFDTLRWESHATEVKAHRPPARRHTSAVYDPIRDWMMVFGGTGGGKLNDIWAFDLRGHRWHNITPGPPPRIDHVAVFDQKNRQVVVYGGEAERRNHKLHDLWLFHVGEAGKEGNEQKGD